MTHSSRIITAYPESIFGPANDRYTLVNGARPRVAIHSVTKASALKQLGERRKDGTAQVLQAHPRRTAGWRAGWLCGGLPCSGTARWPPLPPRQPAQAVGRRLGGAPRRAFHRHPAPINKPPHYLPLVKQQAPSSGVAWEKARQGKARQGKAERKGAPARQQFRPRQPPR